MGNFLLPWKDFTYAAIIVPLLSGVFWRAQGHSWWPRFLKTLVTGGWLIPQCGSPPPPRVDR